MQEIEDGVGPLRARVVARRRVDHEGTVVAHDGRPVEMAVEHAVGYVVDLPWQRGRSRHVHLALGVQQVVFEQRIGRVDDLHAIDGEGVRIDIRLQRVRRERPHASLPLLHRAAFRAFTAQHDLLGIGGLQAKGHATIRVHFRGQQWLRKSRRRNGQH